MNFRDGVYPNDATVSVISVRDIAKRISTGAVVENHRTVWPKKVVHFYALYNFIKYWLQGVQKVCQFFGATVYKYKSVFNEI